MSGGWPWDFFRTINSTTKKKRLKKTGFPPFCLSSKSSAPQGSCSISCGMPSGHTLESIASVAWVQGLDVAVAKG